MLSRPNRPALPLALGLAASLLQGCHPPSPSTHDPHDDHDHPLQPIQITAFSSNHEVFAEHPPVPAATPTRFITHITDLHSLQPRRQGPLHFRLQHHLEAPLEHLEPAPSRDGIYEPQLTFPKPGAWSLTVTIPAENGTDTIPLPPVTVYATTHDAAHATPPPPPEGILLLKEQQWRIGIGTSPVTRRRLAEHLRLPATVAPRPGALAVVSNPLAGQLHAPPGRPLPQLGDRVEAGQTLALLRPSFSDLAARLVDAEAEVSRTQLALEQAETHLRRVETLTQAEAKSPRDLQEATVARRTAEANRDAALALLEAYRQAGLASRLSLTQPPTLDLRAPIAGTLVAQTKAALGGHLAADQPLFTILEATSVWIEARVPENTAPRLAPSAAAQWESPATPGHLVPITGDGAGRQIYFGILVDPATSTLPLIYELSNPENRLRIGQSLNLYVETAHAEEALAVPYTALVEEAGQPVVYLQLAGETFQRQEVTLGLRDGPWIQILSGLNEGARVVTQGAYAVRLAGLSRTLPEHGHAH